MFVGGGGGGGSGGGGNVIILLYKFNKFSFSWKGGGGSGPLRPPIPPSWSAHG